MNFDFDDTQYLLRDLARDLFAKESPPSRIRELWEGAPFDRRVWKTMADAGIVGLTVPEEFGGSGGDELDLTLVYEEAGRSGLPEPLLETTGVAVPLIASSSRQVQERWLPAIAAGDAIVAVQAPGEPLVAWAGEADAVIVHNDGRLHLAARDAFTATKAAATDPARPLSTIDVDLSKTTPLEGCDPQNLVARGAFGAAAMLNGIAMQLLERTIAYVKDREQFGRPVGSFQAVKHKLATMHQLIETSRPAAWYAAYALARGLPDSDTAVHVAKVAAVRTEEFCNAEALQCHGGIGFTWEDDLHLWLKRGMTLRSTWGTARQHRRHLVATVMNDT